MRRQPPHWANPDSDHSISDEEELGHDCVSLVASVQKKEGSEILSRFELLKGIHESGNEDRVLSHLNQIIPALEDDVEIPDFFDDDLISEDQEKNVQSKISSPDQPQRFFKEARPDLGAGGQEFLNSWSFMSKEAKTLAHFSKPASSHSKQKKSFKGAKGKGKPKFSFRFQSRGEGPSSHSTPKDENIQAIEEVPEILDAIKPVAELLEDIQNEEETPPEVELETNKHDCIEQSKSMAELLDGLQDSTNLPPRNSRKSSNKRGKRVMKSREVSPDDVDCCEPFGDSEMSDNDTELAIPDVNRKTIADQFDEAFGDTFSNENFKTIYNVSKTLRGGLFWRLQQVMQMEKEREMDYLEKKANEALQDEQSCIYVKLQSKHLEAKLTVCNCFVSDNLEVLQELEPLTQLENKGSRKTIIFNQRVSGDVELEVGNCMRIFPPWKEVKVRNDESIILAAYFSNF